jgi:hypothetical protein
LKTLAYFSKKKKLFKNGCYKIKKLFEERLLISYLFPEAPAVSCGFRPKTSWKIKENRKTVAHFFKKSETFQKTVAYFFKKNEKFRSKNACFLSEPFFMSEVPLQDVGAWSQLESRCH